MANQNIQEKITALEEQIALLPKGSVGQKTVNGKELATRVIKGLTSRNMQGYYAADKGEALRIALETGARKAVPLRVCGAFHSPLMASVVEELREALAAVEFRDPEVPVVDSVSGRIETSGEALRRSMAAQPTTPVRWISCSDHMREMGMRFGVELGPGRVLAGLMRYNFPELRVVGVESVEEARRASCLQQGVLDE